MGSDDGIIFINDN